MRILNEDITNSTHFSDLIYPADYNGPRYLNLFFPFLLSRFYKVDQVLQKLDIGDNRYSFFLKN